jgi:putative PIN family toxin of toxin-antitoxin system
MSLLIKLRVVIDTNVFISGLNWGGNPKLILDLWLDSKFVLLMSPYLAWEIVSTCQKFDQPAEDIEKLRVYLATKTLKVVPPKRTAICRDAKDNQILDLCSFGAADFLVTGDKDLLALRKFAETKIVRPKEFLLAV